MFVLNCYIEIGDLVFRYVNEVEIESSWRNFTDKCTIRLPRNLNLKGKSIKDIVKIGQPVVVMFGYDGKFNEEFRGYVTAIKPNTPIEFECQDEMWKLKQNSITKHWKTGVSLKEYLLYITKGLNIGLNYTNIESLGKITLDKATTVEALELLKKEYRLFSFFRQMPDKLDKTKMVPTLCVGTIYDANYQKHRGIAFNYNIIEHDLAYKSKADIQVKVTAVSILANNKRLTAVAGDTKKTGQDILELELPFYDIKDLKTLKAAAEREAGRLKYDGYRGTFKIFGEPVLRHGDVIDLQNSELEPKDGFYYLDSVKKRFGVDGIRQEGELGKSA